MAPLRRFPAFLKFFHAAVRARPPLETSPPSRQGGNSASTLGPAPAGEELGVWPGETVPSRRIRLTARPISCPSRCSRSGKRTRYGPGAVALDCGHDCGYNSSAAEKCPERRYVLPGQWRRGWDSNPRYGFPYTRFPSGRLKPLGHPSVAQTSCRRARIFSSERRGRRAMVRLRTRPGTPAHTQAISAC
jgi:hypothetical protein